MKELSPLTCLRCSEEWTPKVENPRFCPRCKSPLWNTPYRRGPKKTVEERVTGTPAVQEPTKIERYIKDASADGLSYAEQVKLAVERMRK